ncbi:hypothetical protein Taro_023742 [Colocasia esculenta]|uniref:Uncharacterized protein n=1 Tax=Colocasia esculenta TaxID=4460 RepID=A0A843VCE1_COLES|nr:hypothetical protein [Colocasia esculenta]
MPQLLRLPSLSRQSNPSIRTAAGLGQNLVQTQPPMRGATVDGGVTNMGSVVSGETSARRGAAEVWRGRRYLGLSRLVIDIAGDGARARLRWRCYDDARKMRLRWRGMRLRWRDYEGEGDAARARVRGDAVRGKAKR